MAGGRPRIYDKDVYIPLAEAYLESEEDKYVLKGEKMVLEVGLPSLEGLALALDIHRSTVYEWKEEYPEFSDIVEKILASQAQKLQKGGISGAYNATISKLMLSKHGYSDTVKQIPADTDDIDDEQVDKAIAARLAKRAAKDAALAPLKEPDAPAA